MCADPIESLQHWRDHFEGVLNVSSSNREDIVMATHQRQVRDDLGEPPSEREICAAIK